MRNEACVLRPPGPVRLGAAHPAPAAWLPPRPGTGPTGGRRRGSVCTANLGGLGSSSYDSEDAVDFSLNRELERIAQKDKYPKLASHLQLVYDASESSKVEQCPCCRGSREQECNWCHGTGAMTIGETLYCSNTGCAPCPVCRGTGSCQCPHCRGTGKRATWLSQRPPS